jgi:hypothetical protein
MKSKKFEDLRGTNTAIHCPTQEDWDKVSEICGYKWNGKWDDYGLDACITLDKRTYSDIGYLKSKGFTIIPAADFIAANSEQAPDLTGTRPAIEWLQFLPEPYRGLALEAVKEAPSKPDKVCEYKDCVYYSINWSKAKNGSFWEVIHKRLQDPSNPLPPLPSEGVEEEKVEAETDIQKLTKAFNANMQIIDKRLDLMVDLYQKLQGKLEYIEKQLTEIAPKQINPEPAISQTPAEVKLPVTIEEVFSGAPKGSKSYVIQSNGNIGEFEFNEIERVDEYRKESTAKRVRAFMILQAISEAQNEIAPRGEVVWFAELEISKNEIGTKKRYVDSFAHGYGLIVFHSEQGLKDCIEANRELWMDLLKGEQQ